MSPVLSHIFFGWYEDEIGLSCGNTVFAFILTYNLEIKHRN